MFVWPSFTLPLADVNAQVDVRAPSMGAKSLCIPAEQPEGGIKEGMKCINPKCGKDAVKWVMFGRSY